MTQPSDEQARNRFVIIQLVRIGGTAVTVLGLAVWYTDFARPGGWVELGLPMALLGLIASFGVSRLLIRRWRSPPSQ